MIHRLLRKKIVRSRDEHSVSRKDIDPDALKVLYRLSRSGYTAYLVGGGVRDLLLGRAPKDFDVSTDAHPNRIKRLFRNCFLIGRRFRLAHIRFGDKIIETSTFRRRPETSEDGEYHRRDNTFGTPEEDAQRRDFTINGLFYDIETFSVIDHVGGLADLRKGIIRAIGDPGTRFKEDPVRMLRAVRFASRLGFRIERKTYNAIVKHHAEIRNASPPRLLEEISRLFAFRSGCAAMQLLHKTGLLEDLFPEVAEYLAARADGAGAYWEYLRALDLTCGEDMPRMCRSFSTVFYPLVLDAAERLEAEGRKPILQDVAHGILQPFFARFSYPRREASMLVRVIDSQRRFEQSGHGRFSRKRFVMHETFEDALALYAVHVAATGRDAQRLQWWREFADQVRRESGGERNAPSAGEKRRRPRRRRSSSRRDRPVLEDGGSEGPPRARSASRRRRPRRRRRAAGDKAE